MEASYCAICTKAYDEINSGGFKKFQREAFVWEELMYVSII